MICGTGFVARGGVLWSSVPAVAARGPLLGREARRRSESDESREALWPAVQSGLSFLCLVDPRQGLVRAKAGQPAPPSRADTDLSLGTSGHVGVREIWHSLTGSS